MLLCGSRSVSDPLFQRMGRPTGSRPPLSSTLSMRLTCRAWHEAADEWMLQPVMSRRDASLVVVRRVVACPDAHRGLRWLARRCKMRLGIKKARPAVARALAIACVAGDVELARWLVECGASAEHVRSGAYDALVRTALAGQLRALELLMRLLNPYELENGVRSTRLVVRLLERPDTCLEAANLVINAARLRIYDMCTCRRELQPLFGRCECALAEHSIDPRVRRLLVDGGHLHPHPSYDVPVGPFAAGVHWQDRARRNWAEIHLTPHPLDPVLRFIGEARRWLASRLRLLMFSYLVLATCC